MRLDPQTDKRKSRKVLSADACRLERKSIYFFNFLLICANLRHLRIDFFSFSCFLPSFKRSPILLFFLLCLTASAWAKDDLTIGIAQFPAGLHPDINSLSVKVYVLDFATRPISTYDKDWKLVCLLCSELPTIENGLAAFENQPDGKRGMRVTLKLRPDLAWGDGVPLTTRDLVFTWKIGKDPQSGFSDPRAWVLIKSIDVVDDHVAVLHLPSVDNEYNQWGTLLPEHLEAAAAAKSTGPGDYNNQTLYNQAPTTPGLYNGPYLITAYQSGAQIVLEPNPHWPGPAPAFKHIILRTIENTAALQANLLSGDVDMVAGEGIGLTIDQVLALRRQHPDQFDYIFKPGLNYEHIDLKIENPILADLRVRQALLFAIDRKTMVDKLFEGLQPVAATWVNPLEANYSPDTPTYAYDPARAKALLAAAGWQPGADGICRNEAGARLSIDFATTAGNRLRELQQQVMQSQWKAACVEIIVRNEPARTLFGQTLKQRAYTGMVMYAWSSAVGGSPRQTLHSSQIPTATNGWGGNNTVAFNDPRMDTDIEQAESELDPAKQKPIWVDMQRLYAEKLPVLPLFFRADAHVIPKWLKGYTPTGHSGYSPLWAEGWHPG
jgi:peptide/nickel transport system substrate-binding protein